MNFKSLNSVYYIEDEILTIAFADSQKPNPTTYLILQREIDNSELYYYEFCSREFSNEGGIKKVVIKNNLLEITFNDNQNIVKQGTQMVQIYFDENKNITQKLIDLFSDSDVELSILNGV